MEREHYRTFLLRISEHITDEKLKQLKYLCSDDIPEGDLEKISSPLELFRDLERRKMIGIDNLSFLQKLLADVTCFQLATKVDDFTSRREVELLCLKKQRRHVNCRGEVRKIEGAPMAGGAYRYIHYHTFHNYITYIFVFPVFLFMVMNDNHHKTKENTN